MCSVHDTVEFEKLGIPSTTILTSAFAKAANFQFQAKGMPNHPYIEIPHPVSNLSAIDMRELTLRYISDVVLQLTVSKT